MQHKLLQLQESGTTASISKRWEEGIPVCQEQEDEESLALGPGSNAQGRHISLKKNKDSSNNFLRETRQSLLPPPHWIRPLGGHIHI